MGFRHTLTEFRWYRCEGGYGVLDGSPEHVEEDYPVIVNASEVQEEYHPHAEAPDLHFRLAEMPPDIDGCLAFITRFGCFEGILPEQYQRAAVAEILDLRSRVRSIMYEGEGDWSRKSDRFNRLLAGNNFTIHLNPDIPEQYFILPSNLSDFIIMLVARDIGDGIFWRECANPKCPKRFPISAGSGTLSKRGTHTTRRKVCRKESCRKAVQRLAAREAA